MDTRVSLERDNPNMEMGDTQVKAPTFQLPAKAMPYARDAKAYAYGLMGAAKMAAKQVRPPSTPRGRAVLLSLGGRRGSPFLASTLSRLGYELHVLSKEYPGYESAYASKWHRIDALGDYEKVLQKVEQIEPDFVFSEMKNILLPVKAGLLEDLKLGDFGVKSAMTSTSKIDFRRALDEAGARSVKWCLLADLDNHSIDFPFVIKPDRGTGSRGIHFIENEAELIAARHHLDGFEEDILVGGEMIVEQFVRGRQFDVEGVVHQGTVYPLSLTEEHYDQVEQQFPSSWYLFSPPINDDLKQGLLDCAAETVLAAGVRSGAFHCEMRVSAASGDIAPLDYSNRMGYPKMVSEASSLSFFDNYVGSITDLDFDPPRPSWGTVFQRFIKSPRELQSYLAMEVALPDNIIEFRKQPNSVAGVQRYGRISLRADDFGELSGILERFDVVPDEWATIYDRLQP